MLLHHLPQITTTLTLLELQYSVSTSGNGARQQQAADAEIPSDLNKASLIRLRHALLHISKYVMDGTKV